MNPSLPTPSTMYRALVRRDASYEGVFWVGVRTTGVVCRPTCAAKKPQRANVEFFGRLGDAIAAGYRPCKRCQPLRPSAGTPAWLEPLFDLLNDASATRLRDADLRARGLEPARVRRWFLKTHGLTFHAYQRNRRLGQALLRLQHGESVTATTLNSGYESFTGFRDAFDGIFGMKPGEARLSREPGALFGRRLTTPLGPMVAVAAPAGLCLLEFADRPMLATQFQRLRQHLGAPVVDGQHPYLDQIERELEGYFNGELRCFETPLVSPGTAFQTAAWAALKTIPYGQTISYAEQACRMGQPEAQRAVGRANGDNRLAIVIPCHRVIRADGTLCGYGGGLWRKRRLLELESAACASESVPPELTTSPKNVSERQPMTSPRAIRLGS